MCMCIHPPQHLAFASDVYGEVYVMVEVACRVSTHCCSSGHLCYGCAYNVYVCTVYTPSMDTPPLSGSVSTSGMIALRSLTAMRSSRMQFLLEKYPLVQKTSTWREGK